MVMTFGKASALTIGFLGAVALGVWLGLHVLDRATVAPREGGIGPEAPKAVTPASPAAATSRPMSPAPIHPATTGPTMAVVSPSAPELYRRLKPLLNPGANMTISSAGFRDAEQFAAVVHAARNTSVPFMLLKHRVLTENKSLTSAIRESKPHMNAAVEARRAGAEAEADVKALGR